MTQIANIEAPVKGEAALWLFMTSTTDRRLKLMGWARLWMSYHPMGHWLVARTVGSHILQRKAACTSMGID